MYLSLVGVLLRDHLVDRSANYYRLICAGVYRCTDSTLMTDCSRSSPPLPPRNRPTSIRLMNSRDYPFFNKRLRKSERFIVMQITAATRQLMEGASPPPASPPPTHTPSTQAPSFGLREVDKIIH